MLLVEYRSGPKDFKEFHVQARHEFMYVVEAEFEVELDEHGVEKLTAGDTLFYGGGVGQFHQDVPG